MIFQFPVPPPNGFPDPPPTHFDQIMSFVVLYILALLLISLCLPRAWFRSAMKTLLPFLPERLENLGRKK